MSRSWPTGGRRFQKAAARIEVAGGIEIQKVPMVALAATGVWPPVITCVAGRGTVSLGCVLVDLDGFEPSTSSMPWKRAPNCATGPLVFVLTISYARRAARIDRPLRRLPTMEQCC